MRYIFFGSPRFAEIVLRGLLEAGLPPIALVCNPDKPVGRKKVITPPSTKALVSQSSVEILQPEKLDKDFLDKLKELNADFYIVAAYAKILKKELLDIPPLGVIGVHPSLLPHYRGSSPIQSTILNQESITGLSLFMIDEKVDHGPILDRRITKIDNKDYSELEYELAELGAKMLVDILPKFMKKEVNFVEQDEGAATHTRKFETSDGFVEYSDIQEAQDANQELAAKIDAKIKALSKEPGVYTIKDDKRVKLLKSEIANMSLRLKEIQFEGKSPREFNSIL